MTQNLKYVRIAASIVWLVVTALVFVDVKGLLSSWMVSGITWVQFLPSALRLSRGLAIAGLGCLVVVLLTLLFGRIYCSLLCPLGTLQDIVSFLARKIHPKRFQLMRPRYDLLRFGLLLAVVATLIGGYPLLAGLLDPFSGAGRVLSAFVRPIVGWMNNLTASALELFGSYALYPVDHVLPGLVGVVGASVTLGVVGYLAYTRGRLYCNTLCPVGALLGVISRFSLVRVAIDKGDCTGCGLCERVCKSGCIDRKSKTVDFDRCVSCFNCFESCPRDGMTFSTPWNRPENSAPVDRGRRRILRRGSASLAVLAFVLDETKKIIKPTKPSTIPVGSALPSSPPGSISIDRFTAICTACHACVDACPAHVLQPTLFEYGISGMLQPKMEYHTAYCTFDCTLCGEICPTGAILPLTKDAKKLAQIGVAKFEKRNCIVNTEHTDCGACSEHCPTKAVTMVPFEGKLVIPEVHAEYCIGCGACEHACPTRPYRSIYVESNRVHQLAKKPPEQHLQPAAPVNEDFPF